MAASPRFKLYTPGRGYVASCSNLEDAAGFVAFLGEGATVRCGHRVMDVIWTEGTEAQPAGESYDHAAGVMRDRMQVRHLQRVKAHVDWLAARAALVK
jgi:hypothetical protein